MAFLTFPSIVFTQVNSCFSTLDGPPPVSMLQCGQVSTIARKHGSPSEVTSASALRCCRAQRSTQSLRKPASGVMRRASGRPSALQATAATNGVLPAAPRPRLPPRRSPPQNASSTCTEPVSGLLSSRSLMASMILCLSSQAVLYDTPRCLASAMAESPDLLCVSRKMARNQVVNGNLVFSNSVRAVSDVCDGSDGTESAAAPSVRSWYRCRIPDSGSPQASVA